MTNYNASQVNGDGVNTSVQWTCFSKGAPGQPDFPNVAVTDLQINYCAGVLLAATLGRSAWETPLWAWDTYHPAPVTTINTNTTWNSDKFLTNSVIVKSGKTLTITTPNYAPQTVIHMPSESYIHVEPGGKLIVNNSKLTNSCQDCFWKGIEASGKSAQEIGWTNPRVQSPTNVATVIIQGGSVVEHARNAVCNYSEVAGQLDNVGGIIQVSNSTFRNNRRSLCWISYLAETSTGQPAADKSFASLCTFDIDDNWRGYANNMAFGTHASLDQVFGVSFYGNTFSNHSTFGANKGSGSGIHSYASQYKVVPACNAVAIPYPGGCPAANVVHNSFEDLTNGIYATGAMNFITFGGIGVDQATFNRNAVGVYFDGADLGSVLRSNFTIGNAFQACGPNCNQNIGIYAKDGAFSRIEENAFEGSGTREKLGVVAENTGVLTDKKVYKCSFKDLDYGGFAKGNNAKYGVNAYQRRGLLFLCNTFTGNDTDIVAYGTANTSFAALHPLHGTANEGTGNTFPTNGGVIRYFGPTTPQFYHNNGNTKPNSITGFLHYAVPNTPACPSLIPSGSGGSVAMAKIPSGQLEDYGGGLRSEIAAAATEMSALEAALDNGNTQSILESIDAATTEDPGEIYNFIMETSPYSSETVLRALVNKDVLSLEETVEVLAANPDVLRAPGFMDFLKNDAPSIFPEDALNELEEASNEVTERGESEVSVANHVSTAGQYFNVMSGDLAFDTSLVNADSLAAWYSVLPTAAARFAKAAVHSTLGQYEDADKTYAEVAEDLELTMQELAERMAYMRIDTLLRTMKTEGQHITSMMPTQLAMLESLMVAGNGRAAVTAGKLVAVANNNFIRSCVEGTVQTFYPTLRRAARGNRFGGSGGTAERPLTANRVDASPNPTSEAVTFQYYLPVHKGTVAIFVRDASGRNVFRRELEQTTGKVVWDVRTVSPGTYLYSVRDARRGLAEGKIVVKR